MSEKRFLLWEAFVGTDQVLFQMTWASEACLGHAWLPCQPLWAGCYLLFTKTFFGRKSPKMLSTGQIWIKFSFQPFPENPKYHKKVLFLEIPEFCVSSNCRPAFVPFSTRRRGDHWSHFLEFLLLLLVWEGCPHCPHCPGQMASSFCWSSSIGCWSRPATFLWDIASYSPT